MLCPICKHNAVDIAGYGAQAVCDTCDQRALNGEGRRPYTDSHDDEGDNPVFIDGRKCWRRYRFGGYITFLDEWDSLTLVEFYAAWVNASKETK